MRAIDEIEDHEEISNDLKYHMLMQISDLLKTPFDSEKYLEIINPVKDKLPEVTVRLEDWLMLALNTHGQSLENLLVKWRMVWQNGQKLIGELNLAMI